MTDSQDTPDPRAPAGEPNAEAPKAPLVLERARSSRSSCKACKKPIQKDKFRLGVLIEGPFGPGYLWHHLSCAARRRFDDVVAAYAEAPKPLDPELPPLDELKQNLEVEEKKKAEKKEAPYVERAKTGRSKCRVCDQLIAEGEWRVIVLRNVEFYNQTRSGPINVHPRCVRAALDAPDSATPKEGFVQAVKDNSGLADAELADAIAAIGALS
jgi:hypothetical protein